MAVSMKSSRLSVFGEALRDAITIAKWTQRDVAAEMGVEQPTIANWVGGVYEPRTEQVFKLEQLLDTGPGALSRHLGYLPPEAVKHSPTVVDAIHLDSSLTPVEKEILLGAYAAALASKKARRGRPSTRKKS